MFSFVDELCERVGCYGLSVNRKPMGNQCCGCVSLTDQGLGNNRVGSADNAPGTRLADTTDSAVEIKAGLCNADPITKQGKRIQMAQMLCIPLVPIVILVVQACLSLVQSVASKVRTTLRINRRFLCLRSQ